MAIVAAIQRRDYDQREAFIWLLRILRITHDVIFDEEPLADKVGGSYIVAVQNTDSIRTYYRFDTPQQALHFADRMDSQDIYHEVDDQDDWYEYDFDRKCFVYP